MFDWLKDLAKQPWWVVVLLLGAVLVVIPTIGIDRSAEGYVFATHPPTTLVPVGIGVFLVAVAVGGALVIHYRAAAVSAVGASLDLSRVREVRGELSTLVADCEIRVVNGRIEQYARSDTVVVLPCNEYFDDRCVDDVKSALGAYVNRVFEGQVPAFVSLMKSEAASRLGPGEERRKTREETALSFGTGRCLLLLKPLGHSTPVALISTTTQRPEEGLSSRISYVFEGMRTLVSKLADARLSEVVMPLMGAGHGRIEKPLALIGLLLAIAEVAHYGQGSQRLRRATVVVFQSDQASKPEVDHVVVQRALVLIGSASIANQ
ncbi:MAG: hypothetical protein HY655_01975 [Acidobacteria bacterium]|nr:hypothetical protein [Acidobacteriota bacterium]